MSGKRVGQNTATIVPQCRFCFTEYDYHLSRPRASLLRISTYSCLTAQGEANAQHNLGICFARGVGVAEDRARAEELLARAERQGHPGAAAARRELWLEDGVSTATP